MLDCSTSCLDESSGFCPTYTDTLILVDGEAVEGEMPNYFQKPENALKRAKGREPLKLEFNIHMLHV